VGVQQERANRLNVGSLSIGYPAVDVTSTQFDALAGVTPGTVTAEKGVIVDSLKDISAFRNVTATNYDAGASGTAGTVDIFPTTASKGKTSFTAADNTGNTTTTITTALQATTRTYTIPDAGVSAARFRLEEAPTVASGDGAITVKSGVVFVTKAGVCAMTLANPTATVDDGNELVVISVTANAHTLSNFGGAGFNGGGTGTDIGTFGGAKGDGIVLRAYQGVWYIVTKTNITLG
jgi:hypothetical protein